MIKELEANPKNLRSFGIGAGVILAIFAFFSWKKGGNAYPYLLGASALMALTGAALPRRLTPLFKVWMKIAGVLAIVNTFLLMGIVYYILLSPYALFRRLTGADPLDLAFEPNADSYWKKKEPITDPNAYERQF